LGGKGKKSRLYREVGKYASLGLEMALSVVIGLAFGAFLDKRLKTGPWLTLLFLILGFAAGFRSLLRAARKSARDTVREDKEADRDD
jgi:ATP synthase protein I